MVILIFVGYIIVDNEQIKKSIRSKKSLRRREEKNSNDIKKYHQKTWDVVPDGLITNKPMFWMNKLDFDDIRLSFK